VGVWRHEGGRDLSAQRREGLPAGELGKKGLTERRENPEGFSGGKKAHTGQRVWTTGVRKDIFRGSLAEEGALSVPRCGKKKKDPRDLKGMG